MGGADDSQSKLSPLLPESAGEGIDIDPIRTETIFSRMPLHVLSKSGPRPQINIEKRSADGKIAEKWEVTYNEKYGPARQLAYDLHTLVIERAIEEAFDEARRTNQPFPRLIPLSSLNDVANRLGPNSETRNTNRIKKALSQNAGILISALKRYRGSDGIEYTLEGVFTPYGIFFFGQKLPSGARADQVYINLNDAYFEAWSRSSSRPLDYNYKAQLPPIPRRFYELVSYAIYGAIKNGQPTARYRYSEFCKNAPQLRYDVFDQVKKQMYKIHRPHVEQGYIVKVKYEEVTDDVGKPDWWMVYVPGPRAYTEFTVFTGKKPRLDRGTVDALSKSQLPAIGQGSRRRSRQGYFNLAPAANDVPTLSPVVINYQVIAELQKRGVGETDARTLLASLPPGQPVLEQLEYADHLIELAKSSRKPIQNTPGFYISLLQRNVPVPSTFETSQARKARLEAESAQQEAFLKEQESRLAAEEAEAAALDAKIEALTDADRLTLLSQAKAALIAEHPKGGGFMANYFSTHPEALSKNGIGWIRARRMVREGWTPEPTSPVQESHYAINSPSRQADRLQESTPLQTVADQPQSALVLNLETILTTLQLMPPPGVEQGSVKPTPAQTSPVRTDPKP